MTNKKCGHTDVVIVYFGDARGDQLLVLECRGCNHEWEFWVKTLLKSLMQPRP